MAGKTKSMYDLSRELSDRITLEKQYAENLAHELEFARKKQKEAIECLRKFQRWAKGVSTENETIDLLVETERILKTTLV